ncbi:MAG: methyl-accepting chemotaxis protein, partial [Pirellulales bacterium]
MLQSLAHLQRNIVGRMVLFVVIPTAILFVSVLTLVNRRNFAHLNQLSERQLESFAEHVAVLVEDHNNNAVLSAQRMAEAQMAGMFGMRRESIDFAETVLRDTPGITAAYFGYEPNADGQDASSREALPKESMDATGRFIPYWFVDVSKRRSIELEPLVDMETSLYYRGAKEAFQRTGKATAMVTEPYVYQGKMVVEQTYPIVMDGKFMGIAGIDRALADVAKDLRRLAEEAGLDLFLISSRGKFIATTTDPLRESMRDAEGLLTAQQVRDTPFGSLFDRLINAKTKPVLEIATDPVEQGTYCYVAAAVPTGNWVVVARLPRRAILSASWEQLRAGVGMALLLLAMFLFLLIRMTRNLSRRVNQAVEAADRVASGDLTEEIDPGKAPDETGRLLKALKTMMDNLNKLVGNVRQASIRLHSTSTELAATGHQQEATASAFGASTTEIAAALKQISATGNELVRTMDEVSSVATGTAKLATDG